MPFQRYWVKCMILWIKVWIQSLIYLMFLIGLIFSVWLAFSQNYLHHEVPCGVVYQIKVNILNSIFQKSFKTPLKALRLYFAMRNCYPYYTLMKILWVQARGKYIPGQYNFHSCNTLRRNILQDLVSFSASKSLCFQFCDKLPHPFPHAFCICVISFHG